MTALILTVLLAIGWIAFVGLGYWHGGWRQLLVLAGTLFAYAVLSEWAAPNGRDLATHFHWSLARTTTGIALLYLLGGTLVLGWLGSFALQRPRPLGGWERLVGGVVGALNGGLLLALILRTFRSYAFLAGDGKALGKSPLSRFLIEEIGYVLLAAFVLGVIAVPVALIAGRRRSADAPLIEQPMVPETVPAYTSYAPPAPTPLPPARALPTPPPMSPALEPVYASEPIIDWPISPPPGQPVESSVAPSQPSPVPSPPPVPPAEIAGTAASRPSPVPLPTEPTLPRRIAPPMIYPVAALIATQTKAAKSAVTPPQDPAPAVRPTTPPPGAPQPALMPAADARDAETIDAPNAAADRPAVPEDVPPVVRELIVDTQDTPRVEQKHATTQPEPASAAPRPTSEGETMQSDATTTVTPLAPPMVSATTPIPTVVPPPLPPIQPPRPGAPSPVAPPGENLNRPPERVTAAEESAKARSGFARVAVARQAGARPDPPPTQPPTALQPPAQPEPTHPPLPNGPRVHACPTCGYPVRDHARYCPNCGSHQRQQ